MCGRYSLTTTPDLIIEHFQLLRQVKFQASYNIPPGQKILCIVELEDQSRKAVNLHWGLVPSWSKDAKNSAHLINARAETVREKPSFRSAFKQRHCLIPADGFFEWQKQETGKQAFHIHREDGQLFAFAGLWEQWPHEAETLYSCTIITTAATDLMQPIHARMPVIIPPEHYHHWLDKATGEDDAWALLENQAYSQMTSTPVSDWVNSPLHNDARCVEAMPIRH